MRVSLRCSNLHHMPLLFPAVSHAQCTLILIRISLHETTTQDDLFSMCIESALSLMHFKCEIINALPMRIIAKCEKAFKLLE